ncbi:MAG: hypothetical protein ABSG01_08015 [Anaerolineales bacterium]|jgi:hypothetical protein
MTINPNDFNELLNDDQKVQIAKHASPLEMGLIILTLAKDKLGLEYLSTNEIVTILETLGISVYKRGIQNSFNSSGHKYIKIDNSGKYPKYKAMIIGKEYVKEWLLPIGPSVLYIEGGKPFTTRKKLEEIIHDLKGDICICDTYLGERSFDIISSLPKECKLKFLTSHLSGDPEKIRRVQKDFLIEHPKSEFRLYQKQDLHDRYIVTNNNLLIIGHGIKDIGNRESFIIIIDSLIGQDTIANVKINFDDKWKSSQIL